jgi:hypothetical protein
MKWLWCWRCKYDMPMLDEAEYAEMSQLYTGGIRATKEYRERWNVPLKDTPIQELFRPVRAKYKELTGMDEWNHLAILHHRLSLYGPPCKQCGKPLRTPQAKLCGACMHPVDR